VRSLEQCATSVKDRPGSAGDPQPLVQALREAYIGRVLKRNPFIVPSAPVSKASPPRGDGWLHEVKFDGWRLQLHRRGRDVALFTKNGHDYTRPLPSIAHPFSHMPGIHSAVIDGELVASDDRGVPDFLSLHFRAEGQLCVWAFDLLFLNDKDLREQPLSERRRLLQKIILRAHTDWLQFSETFDDGTKLLASCERMGLEGIVSKKKDAPYRSGKCDWIKVKCPSWREANKNRGDLFNNNKARR
jgi:bifunctional non-homologous end joining protein LigD